MAFLSCEEMLAAARSQKISLAEAVLRSDLEESRLTETHSRAAMRHLWQVMQATSQEYDPAQRSRSGLSGGDAAKVEQAWQQGRLLGDDYLAAVTAEALKPMQRALLHPGKLQPEQRALQQRLHGAAHHRDALEQQPKAEHRLAHAAAPPVFAGQTEQHPAKQQQIPPAFHPERQQLCCDRCTDIRPEHHRHRPPQLQQPRRQKGNDHDRDRRAALQHCRYRRTGQQSCHRVCGAPRQQAAQPPARPLLYCPAQAVRPI